MKKIPGLFFGAILLIPAATYAADTSKPANNKPVNSWTCEDFLALESTFRPTAVGYAEALNNKDKPEDAVIDVQGIETVTPAVIEACTQDKESSFKDKVHNEWDKLKRKA